MVDQEQRKLKPIYGEPARVSRRRVVPNTAPLADALDSGSYKTAIQTCNKLLKKQPQHEVIRVRFPRQRLWCKWLIYAFSAGSQGSGSTPGQQGRRGDPAMRRDPGIQAYR